MSGGRGAGDAPITYHGVWDMTRQYDPRSIVLLDGDAYLAVARSTGASPDPGSETPWFPLGGVDPFSSTVGPGLPLVTGRGRGDFHYNETVVTEFVLTGVAGTAFLDNFNTVASGASIHGRAVPGAGGTGAWSADPSITGNGAGQLAKTDGINSTWRGGSFEVPSSGTLPVTISAVTVWPSISTTNCRALLNLRGASETDGYSVVASAYDGLVLQIAVSRANVQVASGHTPAVAPGSSHVLAASLNGGVLTATWDGAPIATYTDGAPLTADTTQRRTQGFMIGTGTLLDSFTVSANETRAWVPTSPAIAAVSTVQEEGTSLTQRPTLNFIGSAVTATDDAANGRTNVTISVPATGITIEDENVSVGAGVTKLDFQGAGVAAAAGTGEVVVTVPGPAGVVTAKGDLIVGIGPASIALLPVGTNTYVLTADATQASGIKWAALPVSGISVQDENVTLGSGITQLDFQGAGVTAALVGGEVVVTVPGGGVDTTAEHYKGAWSATSGYAQNDVVTRSYGLYIALATVAAGTDPTAPAAPTTVGGNNVTPNDWTVLYSLAHRFTTGAAPVTLDTIDLYFYNGGGAGTFQLGIASAIGANDGAITWVGSPSAAVANPNAGGVASGSIPLITLAAGTTYYLVAKGLSGVGASNVADFVAASGTPLGGIASITTDSEGLSAGAAWGSYGNRSFKWMLKFSGVSWAKIANLGADPTNAGVAVQDENVTVASLTAQLDFQGSGVTATAGTGEVIVTVRGSSTRAVTATGTLLLTDEIVLASNTVTLTLPSASGFVGRRMTVKNIGSGTVTITPASGTLDGAANKALAVQYSSVDLVTDGTNWFEV